MPLKGDVSNLDRFQYGGKPVLPERNSYSVKLRGGVVSSDISGGLSRQQVQFTNSPYQVSVNYVCLDQAKASWIANFIDIRRGKKFIATLLVGGVNLDEFVVQVIGQPSFKTTGINGSVSLTLQVEPAVDRCFIDWSDWAYQCTKPKDWCDVFKYTNDAVFVWPSYADTRSGNYRIPLTGDLSIYEEFI